MTGWRVVDLTEFNGRLGYRRGQLLVHPQDGEPTAVPLADLGVVLIGLKVSVSAAILHQFAEFDVVVLVCGWNRVPVAGCAPWGKHTRIGARQLAQFQSSLPSRKNAWGRIIRAKVSGQQANLACLSQPAAKRLALLGKEIRSGDPNNIEAQAARIYWSSLFADDREFTRNPGSRSGRNGLLNYGYTVLRGHAIRAVLSAGLAAAVGLFHRGRTNPFNLADDLIEPFRPVVDWCVAQLPPSTTLDDPETKHALVAASSSAFTASGHSAATELTALAQSLGRYFEGDITRLTVPRWDPGKVINCG